MTRDAVGAVVTSAPDRAARLTSLFPALDPVRVSPRGVLLTALAVCAGTATVLARQDGAGALDTVWAEDGTIFLQQALDRSPADTVLHPYAGYVHVVPRLAAELAAALPVASSGVVLSLLAAGGAALLALLVFFAARGHIRDARIRGVLAAMVLVLPVAQVEALNNVANLHWFLMFAGFWALLGDAPGRVERWLRVGVLLLAALSDPLAQLLLPLALARLIALRRRGLPAVVALIAGALTQATVILGADRAREFPVVLNPLRLGRWYVQHVLAKLLFGPRFASDGGRGVVMAVVALAVLAGVVLWVVRSAAIWRAPVVLVTAVASVVFFVVPAALAGLAAPRYAVIPALLLLSLVAYMIDGRLVAGWGALAGLRWPAVAAVVLAVVVVGANFRVTNERSAGPRWSRETDAARDGCAHSVQGDARVAIAPADWTISIPCGAFAG